MLYKLTFPLLGALLATATALQAAEAPAEIKLGTLYASSGRYASISMPVHYGLKLWVDQKNAEGGIFVKAFDKKIPLKLVAYDDQSNTATAATLYNQLITQDKVDILIADSGSVLTSVAVPIARDQKKLLIDQTGTGANFFTPDNPYIVLMSDPVSSIWPKPLADFITHDGRELGIKRVALLYCTNDFTGTQANAVRKFIKEANAGVDLVYDQGIPTETSSYTVLLNNIRATNPHAVIQLGYAPNDIAFLRNLQDSGIKFKFLFSIYPGLETELLEKNVGSKGLSYVYTYVPSSELSYQTNFGMTLDEYRAAWHQKYVTSNDWAGAGKSALGHRQPGSTRAAQGDLQPLGQPQDLGRHLRARPDRRPNRRDHAARPAHRRRARPSEIRHGVAARRGDREAGVSAAVTNRRAHLGQLFASKRKGIGIGPRGRDDLFVGQSGDPSPIGFIRWKAFTGITDDLRSIFLPHVGLPFGRL